MVIQKMSRLTIDSWIDAWQGAAEVVEAAVAAYPASAAHSCLKQLTASRSRDWPTEDAPLSEALAVAEVVLTAVARQGGRVSFLSSFSAHFRTARKSPESTPSFPYRLRVLKPILKCKDVLSC